MFGIRIGFSSDPDTYFLFLFQRQKFLAEDITRCFCLCLQIIMGNSSVNADILRDKQNKLWKKAAMFQIWNILYQNSKSGSLMSDSNPVFFLFFSGESDLDRSFIKESDPDPIFSVDWRAAPQLCSRRSSAVVNLSPELKNFCLFVKLNKQNAR